MRTNHSSRAESCNPPFSGEAAPPELGLPPDLLKALSFRASFANSPRALPSSLAHEQPVYP
jgi:hypothetical protein